MRFLEGFDPEDVLDVRERDLVKDFSCPHSFVLEVVLRAEVLRHTVPSLHPHVLTLFVHKLIGSPLLTRLDLIWSFGIELLLDRL